MTAADGGFEFGDPEETAGNAANSAFQKVVLRKSVTLLGVLAAVMGGAAADYAFGVMALWLLPRLPLALLAGLMAGEVSLTVRSYLAARAARRKADALLPEGERQEAALDRMRRPVPAPWWRESPPRRRFWAGLAFRVTYSFCAGLVLAHFFGAVPAVIAAVAFTALAMTARARSGSVITSWVAVASFADPRPPRDTPET